MQEDLDVQIPQSQNNTKFQWKELRLVLRLLYLISHSFDGHLSEAFRERHHPGEKLVFDAKDTANSLTHR